MSRCRIRCRSSIRQSHSTAAVDRSTAWVRFKKKKKSFSFSNFDFFCNRRLRNAMVQEIEWNTFVYQSTKTIGFRCMQCQVEVQSICRSLRRLSLSRSRLPTANVQALPNRKKNIILCIYELNIFNLGLQLRICVAERQMVRQIDWPMSSMSSGSIWLIDRFEANTNRLVFDLVVAVMRTKLLNQSLHRWYVLNKKNHCI